MLLYHGSNTEVSNPQILESNRHLDFGKGFYLTSSYEQAKRWAKETIKRLMPQKLCDQYTFRTENAIKKLKFVEVK